MQTYEPAGPGMTICVSGGTYMTVKDHEQAMKEKDEYCGDVCDQWVITVSHKDEQIAALRARLKVVEDAYSELIMEVAEKYPNETRHETAKRYLREGGAIDVLSPKQAIKQAGGDHNPPENNPCIGAGV